MLTLQFVPYADIEHLGSDERIERLLNIVKGKRIVLMQGRLHPEEEALLIRQTMEQVQKEFIGIEICTIFPQERNLQFFNKMRKEMVKFLVGNRDGITLIGPASVVKEIRRDPNRLNMFTITPRIEALGKKNGNGSARKSTHKKSRRGR